MSRILLALLLLIAAAHARAEDALYADLGGGPGVARIADGAIGLYMTDPRLKDDFDNIAPDRLRARFADFVCQVAGGPCHYAGRSMAEAHHGLAIDQAHFNAVVEDLQIAMDHAGIAFWTQNRLLALLAPMQRDIVTK